MGAVAHPDGDAVTQGQRTRATNVVAMLVGNEDCVDVFWSKPGLAQPMHEVLEPQPAVNKHPKGQQAQGLHQCGIARTATAQAFEPQHRCSRQ